MEKRGRDLKVKKEKVFNGEERTRLKREEREGFSIEERTRLQAEEE